MKKDPRIITPRNAKIAVMKVSGKNNTEIAEEVGLNRKSVKAVLDKPAIREMILHSISEHEFTLSMLAKKHIEMLSATKEISVAGVLTEVADNVAQVAAMKELNSIFGVYAPKELDIRASTAERSLVDLTAEAEAAIRELGLSTIGDAIVVSNDTPEVEN